MNFLEKIERPWNHPIDYLELVFWFVIFVIVSYAMADTLRVLAQWVKQAAD